MANQHAVAIPTASLPFSIPSTAEIVLLTLTPFSENQPPGAFGGPGLQGQNPSPGPQGVVLDGNVNVTATTGTITLRLRYGSLTGNLVANSVAEVTSTTTAVAVTAPIFALDTTLVEVNAVYVLTAQLSAGTGSVNYAMLTAQDATSFE